jgi:energy-coupling factor transporter ATP-binding protein EcfA2
MGAAGQAETEAEESFRKRYLPVSEHARAFDPDVVLVVGDRGSGKSELFRAVFSLGLLPTISTHVSGVRLQPLKPQATIWRKGYPVGADFPDASGQRRFAGKADSVGQVEELWFAYLVRTVADLLRPEDRAAMSALIDLPGGDADRCYRTFHQLEAQPLLALDALDRQLVKEDRWIFVGYDELDTLGGYDWHVTNAMIRGLTSFWASYARRWVRLRAKLFVRSDLYRRSTETVGADIAKLAANRAELSWSDKNMYAMLVKRIANSDERLYELCVKARISFNRDDRLAYVPTLQSAEDARQLINTLCQQYMGTNSNKGITFRWVLDHVRDGRKKAHPRSFVRLIERAAEKRDEATGAIRRGAG